MPTLLELQKSVGAALISGDLAAAEFLVADGIAPHARLNIYRNTYLAKSRGRAEDFLSGGAEACRRRILRRRRLAASIDAHPPQSAYLNDYGGAACATFSRNSPGSVAPLSRRRCASRMGRECGAACR
jgi:hypothetical protein